MSATTLDGNILVTGGTDTAGSALASAEIYDFSASQWLNVGNLNTARSKHEAALVAEGTVLITGGTPVTTSSELFDPLTNSFTEIESMGHARYSHQSTAPSDGRVIVTDGYNGSSNVSQFEEYK
jgi:hypothetical protein